MTRYGAPTPDSLDHRDLPGEGLRPWLRGHGWPEGAPTVAVVALTAAAVGAAVALGGATLPWIGARLVDHRNALLDVTYRGTSARLPGYRVIALAVAAAGLTVVSRSRPSRPWLSLLVAAAGAAIAVTAVTALDETGGIRGQLLSVPLFLEDTSGVRAHTSTGYGWWLTLAGGLTTTVAALTAFAALTLALARARPAGGGRPAAARQFAPGLIDHRADFGDETRGHLP